MLSEAEEGSSSIYGMDMDVGAEIGETTTLSDAKEETDKGSTGVVGAVDEGSAPAVDEKKLSSVEFAYVTEGSSATEGIA